jgi:predicted MFS family arabinose efflux permease
MAVLSQVPESMRGAVMGLNITCASVGWIGAASLGALMIAPWGFASLGLLAAAVALLGAGLSFIPAVARFGR